ncbi:MAG: hypothetical protein EOP50_01655 [Sphingobacteriales bacterium]|nr:MAG: hypothetical protein EOP50_01655 [Sphingobacteriales bacterium]
MEFKSLLQVFGRPWLMEESQAMIWADYAHSLLVRKDMNAVPTMDPRTYSGAYNARAGQMYSGIYRVDSKGNMNPTGEVQVISLDGPVMISDYCGAPGMAVMQQVIRAANADETVTSIVLFIDSPGGTAAGTQNLANEVKASKKPVVAFIRNMMCSAAYWVGSSATEVILNNEVDGTNATIGSIGTKVFIMQPDPTQPKVISITASKSSRKGKYSEEIMSGNYDRLIAELDQLNEFFLAGVKKNRGQKLRLDLENVLDGETYMGKEAIQYGLIDRMGTFEMAVKRSLQLAKTLRA